MKREREIKLRRWLYHIAVSYFLIKVYMFLFGFLYGMLDWGLEEVIYTAPITEELSRTLSILIGGYTTYLYTLFFSVGEFVDYLIDFSENVGPVTLDFLILRFVCILAHFFLLWIQVFGYKMSKKYNERRWFWLAILVAILWHYAFNTGIGEFIHKVILFFVG